VTDANINNGFFQKVLDELKRYGAYIRERFLEIVERIRKKLRQFGSRISERFN
jgi:hypothetical protein